MVLPVGKTTKDLNDQADKAFKEGFVDFITPDKMYMEGNFTLADLQRILRMVEELKRSNMN
jgi:hypothetical protein